MCPLPFLPPSRRPKLRNEVKLRKLQPAYYETFRCVGSDCEDTCCSGWRVPVDKETYTAYRHNTHPRLSQKLRDLVQINPQAASDESFAEIKLAHASCPFLSAGLCEIHATLGEKLLSKNCATYPRVMYEVAGLLERSLDLSCPEAARLILTNPAAIQFVERDGAEDTRLGTVGAIDTADPQAQAVRAQVIALLQNRDRPVAARLRLLGGAAAPAVHLNLEKRFETIAELILCRLRVDTTSPRFVECYRQFMAGLRWTMETTMEELAQRLEAAYAGRHAEFMQRNQHVLENYLVASAFKNLFPFGSQSLNAKLAQYGFVSTPARQYQLLVVDFVIVEALLAGVAASYGSSFTIEHAVRVIQSAAKTFQHSLAYPGKAVELLAAKGLADPASVSVLLRG